MSRGPRELARWWLARAKAGDQVASSVLFDLGKRVRGEIHTEPDVLARLKPVYSAALALRRPSAPDIGADPPPSRRRWNWWPFGRRNDADFGADPMVLAPAAVLPPAEDPEAHKPPVPPGTYDGINALTLRTICATAAEYRNGIAGAALILSMGPTIDASWIEGAMEAMSDATEAAAFFQATSESRDPVARCVAMAKWVQRVKDPGRPLGGMVGWELGE